MVQTYLFSSQVLVVPFTRPIYLPYSSSGFGPRGTLIERV